MSFGHQMMMPPGQSPQIKAAKIEMEAVTEMFGKMSMMCHKKCFTKFHDVDLNVGEMSCTDRCVGKYLEAQKKVGEIMQEFTQQQQQMQQQMPRS
jgi:import inner membrane translocase subunit TIM10